MRQEHCRDKLIHPSCAIIAFVLSQLHITHLGSLPYISATLRNYSIFLPFSTFSLLLSLLIKMYNHLLSVFYCRFTSESLYSHTPKFICNVFGCKFGALFLLSAALTI